MEDKKEAPLVVVMGGCGHVGLPLSIWLTLSGWRVIALDVNTQAIDAVNSGELPFTEQGGKELLARAVAKGLRASNDESHYSKADVVVIVTGMDVDTFGNPHIDFLLSHFDLVASKAPAHSLLLLRSTLYPGTVALLEARLRDKFGVKNAADRIAYCPERVSEGFALEEISTLPQIVSSHSEEGFKRAYDLFRTVAPVCVRITPYEAEFAKLMTNAWRYMDFAISNQFYATAQYSGIDFFRVFQAVSYEYPRAKAFCKPGFAAGPCLLKDTRMLISHSNLGFPMGNAAVTTNEGLCEVVLDRLAGMLSGSKSPLPPSSFALAGKTVGILGMAFKANVDDTRQSLSYKLKKLAKLRGATVLEHDPFFPAGKGSSIEDVLSKSDGIVLATPHKEYKGLEITKPIVDVWGAHRPSELEVLRGTRPLLAHEKKQTKDAEPEEKLPTILVTGSAGFIGGYVVQELLNNGYRVLGVDNFSKYGRVTKEYDSHPNYELHQGDVKDIALMKRLALRCDYVLACAAMIGGISYFHTLAYDLLAENDRIIAATFDAAIHAYKHGHLKKIIVLSSSMVFESAVSFPTKEGEQEKCPPPLSTYGFQKLACEYYAKGAHEQYGLPYTIVRPFNCVGVGERRAKSDHEIMSGNIKLAMSHVVPDLIQKIMKGQDPLHILGSGGQVRHYTYGGDLARGIRVCIEHPAALNNDFNISTATSTTVIELAELCWSKLKPGVPFRYKSDEPFKYDVQMRVPDCSKAKEVLGYEATTSLDTILDELIPWIKIQIDNGNL